jgi:hypothetical protein
VRGIKLLHDRDVHHWRILCADLASALSQTRVRVRPRTVGGLSLPEQLQLTDKGVQSRKAISGGCLANIWDRWSYSNGRPGTGDTCWCSTLAPWVDLAKAPWSGEGISESPVCRVDKGRGH